MCGITCAVKFIPRVCVICDTNSMAPWNLFNRSVVFVQLVVEMIPRHRVISALVHNSIPRLGGRGFKLLWNWFREPTPHTSWNWFHGAVELAAETNSMAPWNWRAHF